MAIPTSNTADGLANNTTFKGRVKHFMQKAATSIIGEASPTPNKHDYAVLVLSGQASILEMSRAVVTNAAISSGINMALDDMGVTDADLEFTVNSMWSDFGAKQGDIV
jgi:hypothetical protein